MTAAAPLSIATALRLGGQRRVVGANEPLDLATPGRVWLVLSGTVDLFLVDPAGRFPLAQVPAGGLIDSLTPAGPAAVIAAPSAGTEVLETTRERLAELARHDHERAALDQAWRDWFGRILRRPATADAIPQAGALGFDAACRDAYDRAIAAALEERSAALARRAEERQAASRMAQHDFDLGLGRVVDLIGTRLETGAGGPAETVAGAAGRVLRALGWQDADLHVAADEEAHLGAAVQRIARDNGLQFRVVELSPHWWKADHGPMLGSFGPDHQPCALLRRANRYVLQAGGREQVVGAKLARTISRTAYVFYTPFPESRPGVWQLLRFALVGARADVRNIALAMLLNGFFALVTPIATGWLIDPIIPDADLRQVVVIGALLVLLAIGVTAVLIVQNVASIRLEAHADNRVQAAVWLRLLNLKTPFFRDYTAGDLASRADAINAIRKLLGQSFTTFASATVTIVFSMLLMVHYEWRVAVPVLIASGLFALLASLIGRRIVEYNFQTLELTGRLQGTVLQFLGSVAKLRVAGAERQAFLAWLNVYRRNVAIGLRQRLLNNRLLILRSAFGPFVTVIVLIVLGIEGDNLFAFFYADSQQPTTRPLMSVADFASFNVALGQLIGGVMAMAHASLLLVMLEPYYRRMQPLLAAEEEPAGPAGHVGALAGEIELRDVRFRYTADAPQALRGLSLKVGAGQAVALIGPSGAGKSSIVRLLLGFDAPESGEIYIDGTDLRFLNLREFRQQCGVVLQNGRLLTGSIFDNVAAGLPYSTEEVMEALRIAAFDKDVAALSMGLETSVADGGITFSGGQRQRLLIARAVIRKPRILILDEATSALDNVTQQTVVENLRGLNCSQLIIAQRLSTVVAADVIHVIDAGRVVESGTYAELMEHGPLFQQLARRQLQT